MLAAAVPAVAALPSDLSSDPLDRGALLALPSVYRVDVTIRVRALVTRAGERLVLQRELRDIPESGTAFAAAPGGWLVTAAHVAAPDRATIARLAYQTYLAGQGKPHADEAAAADWVRRTGARPVGPGVVRLLVRPADIGGEPGAARSYVPPRPIRSHTADLALLHIGAPTAPALTLDEAASIGTPVASIGFGSGGAFAEPRRGELEPAVRRGELSRTGQLTENGATRPAMAITAPVEPGDSGGPVVDAEGNVRGVVVLRTDEGGIAERATEVRQLLSRARAAPGPGRAAELFRGAMTAFWALDFADAQHGFAATLAADPGHTLAGVESRRARQLASDRFRLEGRRRVQGFLLALGALSVVAALACGLGLARSPAPPRGGRAGPGAPAR